MDPIKHALDKDFEMNVIEKPSCPLFVGYIRFNQFHGPALVKNPGQTSSLHLF